jgi:ribose transport system substrate-binding protein
MPRGKSAAGMIFDLVSPSRHSLTVSTVLARPGGIPVASRGGGLTDGAVIATGNGAPFADPATTAMLADLGDAGDVLALSYRTGEACHALRACSTRSSVLSPP